MITKEEEYVAEICKIAGFAFIAPFGKIALSIPYIELSELSTSHLLYMALTFSFACIGIMLISKGIDLVKEARY